jgi:hypothetical protein
MPKTVRVGAHTYTILRKTKAAMNGDLGGCDPNTLQISVQKRLRKSVAQETLIHEISHACNCPTFMGKEQVTEEEIVNASSPVWLQVIQGNPDLIEYLTQ